MFFVYTDGTVLVKKSFLLDETELDLVLESRRLVKSCARWQGGGDGERAATATQSGDSEQPNGEQSQLSAPTEQQLAQGATVAPAAVTSATPEQVPQPPASESSVAPTTPPTLSSDAVDEQQLKAAQDSLQQHLASAKTQLDNVANQLSSATSGADNLDGRSKQQEAQSESGAHSGTD